MIKKNGFGLRNYVENGNLIAEVKLPRVKKEDIRIEGGEEGFCVKAKRNKKHYESCYFLGHCVDPTLARADFIKGTLRLRIPLKSEDIHAWPVRLR